MNLSINEVTAEDMAVAIHLTGSSTGLDRPQQKAENPLSAHRLCAGLSDDLFRKLDDYLRDSRTFQGYEPL